MMASGHRVEIQVVSFLFLHVHEELELEDLKEI